MVLEFRMKTSDEVIMKQTARPCGDGRRLEGLYRNMKESTRLQTSVAEVYFCCAPISPFPSLLKFSIG